MSKAKKTRVEMKGEHKCEITEYRKKHPSFTNLFKVRIMSGILNASSRNRIAKLDDIEACNKRIRECKYPDLEKMLFVWYSHVLAKGTPIVDDNIKSKAKEFGSMLGISDGSSFLYSNDWLAAFKARFKLKHHQICSKSSRVSEELIQSFRKETREFIRNLLVLGNGRSIKYIFNVDKANLFGLARSVS